MPLRRPFAVGLGLFAIGLLVGGLAPSMPVLDRGPLRPGAAAAARSRPTAYVAIGRCLPEPSPAARCSRCCPRHGSCPGSSARRSPRSSAPAARLALGVPGPAAAAGRRRWPRALTRCARPCRGAEAAASGGRRPTIAAPAASRCARPLGAGLLVAALGRGRPRLASSRAPPSGLRPPARVPPAHPARHAARSPRACRPPSCCAALMTFAFFAADAYIALLLQTWRGTPPALTGVVFTVTTIAWTARAPGSRPGGSTAAGRGRSSRIGFALRRGRRAAAHPRRDAPAVPPEITIVTWAIAGDRHGRSCTRPSRSWCCAGVGDGGAGARILVAAAGGHPGHGARRRRRRRDHGRGDARGGRRAWARRSAAVFVLSAWSSPCWACSRPVASEPSAPARSAGRLR